MLAYRFLDQKYAIKSIEDRKLRISRIMELNDPFEFLCVDISDRAFRKRIVDMKKTMAKTHGLICFSENWSCPLLWGHYADKHKGLCLGFEIPTDKHLIKQVDYVEKRLSFPKELNEEFSLKLLHTKFSRWKYEQEWRIYAHLKEAENSHYFAEFSESISLKKVIIGCEANLSTEKVKNSLGELAKSVEIIHARPAFREFRVVRNRNKTVWP